MRPSTPFAAGDPDLVKSVQKTRRIHLKKEKYENLLKTKKKIRYVTRGLFFPCTCGRNIELFVVCVSK